MQTILDQSHLVPLSNQIQPTLSEFDHALRLYPLPTAVGESLAYLAFTNSRDMTRTRLFWLINTSAMSLRMKAVTSSTLAALSETHLDSRHTFLPWGNQSPREC